MTEPPGRLSDEEAPRDLLDVLGVLRREQRPGDVPPFLAELRWDFEEVLRRQCRRVRSWPDGTHLYLVPARVAHRDELMLWLFADNDAWDQRPASGMTWTGRAVDPTAASTVGPVVAALAPDGVARVVLHDGAAGTTELPTESNVWATDPSHDAGFPTKVLAFGADGAPWQG